MHILVPLVCVVLSFVSTMQLDQVLLLSLPDSEATVSSENSEGEGPRERERERDGAKKYVWAF